MDISALVAQYIRSTVKKAAVGPFQLVLDTASDNPWRNYAVPEHGATPTEHDVAALVAEFRSRGRTPRLEYVPSDAPAVEPALVAAGFTVEGRPPLMTCEASDLVELPAPDGIVLANADTDEQLLAVAALQNEAYGEPEPVGAADVARLRSTVDRGGVVVFAADGGLTVGAGLCSPPITGVSELAAVAVRGSHRRRGIAGAVCALLARNSLDGGADLVWLEPAGQAEQRIYERAGFVSGGTKLWISLQLN